MTQEDKQLLLNDLCGRLPYKPHVYIKDGKVVLNIDIVLNGIYINDWITVPSCQNMTIKPYLRPMSSMTEEKHCEYNSFSLGEDWISNPYMSVPSFHVMDWLNAHHFDYRGLIEKGLALEAPEGMYKNV